MIAIRPTTTLIAALTICAALAAGCGSSGNGNGGPGGGGGKYNLPSSASSAVDECLKQAKKVSDPSTRKTVEAACNAAKTGNTSDVKKAAREECLKAADHISDAGAKKTAKDKCRSAFK
jgi:hypothetical protein